MGSFRRAKYGITHTKKVWNVKDKTIKKLLMIFDDKCQTNTGYTQIIDISM